MLIPLYRGSAPSADLCGRPHAAYKRCTRLRARSVLSSLILTSEVAQAITDGGKPLRRKTLVMLLAALFAVASTLAGCGGGGGEEGQDQQQQEEQQEQEDEGGGEEQEEEDDD
jgi:hypothetical protein